MIGKVRAPSYPRRHGGRGGCYNFADMHNPTTPYTTAGRPIRLLLVLLLLLSWLSLSAFGSPPGVNPTPSDTDRVTQSELDVLQSLSEPTLTARSAVLMDMQTGRILWSLYPERRLAMASTTKMMTVLLALELVSPDDEAIVYPRDEVEGSTAGLEAGERYTIEELLYGALLPSGNDAATAIADHAGQELPGGVGDKRIDVFVAEMNREAARMGLRQTHFANPHGLDVPGQVSSALDLARLGRALLQNPLLAGIVATTKHRVAGYVEDGNERLPVYRDVTTTNELLGTYPGASGVKTGTTEEAGQVLVASAKRGNQGLIAVVMGSTRRFEDTRALFDWGFATYGWVPLSPAIFSSPGGAPGGQPAYAAVKRWNTDLMFGLALPGVPRYWASTEAVDILPIAGSPR